MLFSATLDGDVAKLTRDFQRDPVRHEVGAETNDVQAATHVFWKVDRTDRNAVLADLVKAAWPSVIFCRTRHGADRLVKQLGHLDVECVAIHGGLGQNQRNRALESFSTGRVHALIATDVAARGIHVDGVASVVHYDPPEDHKAYVHRSGRTARAGAAGMVLSLVQPDQIKAARRMQREVGIDEEIGSPNVAALPLAGLDPHRVLVPGSVRQPAAAAKPQRPNRDRSDRRNDWSPRPERAADTRGNARTSRSDRSRSGERSTRNDWSPRSDRPRDDVRRTSSDRPASGRAATTSRSNRAARRAHLQPGSGRG